MRWRRDWAERRKKRANGLAREKLQLPANRRKKMSLELAGSCSKSAERRSPEL
jgi:hypothetical protein